MRFPKSERKKQKNQRRRRRRVCGEAARGGQGETEGIPAGFGEGKERPVQEGAPPELIQLSRWVRAQSARKGSQPRARMPLAVSPAFPCQIV